MVLHLVSDKLAREQRLKVSYSAWARGDETALMAMVADDIEFALMGDPVLNPHAGRRIGASAFRQALRMFHVEFRVGEFLIEKIICQGDDAAVHWHTRLIYKATGRLIESERCDLFAFRDELITRITCFYDSASMAVATGRVHRALAPGDPGAGT